MLEADLEAVNVVTELGVVVEQQQAGQVVHCTATHVLRDEPGEEGRPDESVNNFLTRHTLCGNKSFSVGIKQGKYHKFKSASLYYTKPLERGK